MLKNTVYPCQLTDEEYHLLMNVLHQIGYKSHKEKNTASIVSNCTFTFDLEANADDTFNSLYHKIQNMALQTRVDYPPKEEQ